MVEERNPNVFDLEERTKKFAQMVREYVKNLPRTLTNLEYAKQLIRASGSGGQIILKQKKH
ncbi:MAG: hypothetical protein NC818_00900 [Candidatus Omnitrophica bacterium]|nr:hypothetical protein [Candidatus Omnitrophota bacterium]